MPEAEARECVSNGAAGEKDGDVPVTNWSAPEYIQTKKLGETERQDLSHQHALGECPGEGLEAGQLAEGTYTAAMPAA